AALGGVALVCVDRLFGWETPAWALLGAPAAAGAVVAGVLASRERRRAGDASVALDHALGPRDRISTSNALGEDEADPFAALAREDAERVALDASPRRAIPVRWDSWWLAAPFAAAGLAAAVMLLPRYDVFGRAERRLEHAMLAHQRADAAEALEQAREEIRRAAAEASSDLATPEQLRALEDLEQELAEGAIDPDDARANAASRLDDLAESLARRAERERQSL